MTDKDFTYLVIVQDRSGSIADCLSDQQGGLNSFIAEQRKLPGRCAVTYTQFDTYSETVFAGKPIDAVEPIVIRPRGGTALLDAIGHAIIDTGDRLRRLPEYQRPGSVVFVVNTDGHENSSVRFTRREINAMVREQTERWNWLFVFLSATQDAIAQGASMGFARGQSISYNTVNTVGTYAIASSNVGNYRSATASGLSHSDALLDANFTDEQRAEAIDAL